MRQLSHQFVTGTGQSFVFSPLHDYLLLTTSLTVTDKQTREQKNRTFMDMEKQRALYMHAFEKFVGHTCRQLSKRASD